MTRCCIPVVLLLLFVSGCTETWYKTPSGLRFRIVKAGSGPKAAMGATVTCTYTRTHNDSVTFSNEDKKPEEIILVPGVLQPYTVSEALLFGGQAGATIEMVQQADSMLAKGLFTTLRPGQKKSDQWITRIHVLRVSTPDLKQPGK